MAMEVNEAVMAQPRSKVIGGTLLVAGSCIGAAMLGLPVLTGSAGFVPAQAMFALAWFYMLCTGLLLLEVNLWYGGGVSIISMVNNTLGPIGRAIAWVTYLFLFYTLMIALISGSGAVFSGFLDDYLGIRLPSQYSCLLITIAFGYLVWRGTRDVDYLNRFLMAGLVLCYILLVTVGSSHVDNNLLTRSNWGAAMFVLPAMIISFGFHNLVPSLTAYLNEDPKPLRTALIAGSTLSFFVYLLWQWLILGIVPLEGESGFLRAMSEGQVATIALKNASGSHLVVKSAEAFGLFATTTTFLGVALSFVDFLADGLKVKNFGARKAGLCCLALLPPLLLSLTHPTIFLTALNYAGGFGAVILFGLLPALMVWQGRYRQGIKGKRLLPGGKPALVLIMLASLFIVGLELAQELGYSPMPVESEARP